MFQAVVLIMCGLACLYILLTEFCCDMQILGRTINLRSLIAQRMNKIFRENLEFLFDRFESQDLCAVVVNLFFFFIFLILYVLPFLLNIQKWMLSSIAGIGEADRYLKALA